MSSIIHAFVPDYYKKFTCKCGDCRASCCHGWKINLTMAEYFRLLGMDCDPVLRRRLDCAFCRRDEPSEEEYAFMEPSFVGSCRLLDDNGLCSLQKACGEEALPSVCRLFPRTVKKGPKGLYEAVFSNACEHTVELLMEKTDQVIFSFQNIRIPYEGVPEDVSQAFGDEKGERVRDCIEAMQVPGLSMRERVLRVVACAGCAYPYRKKTPEEVVSFMQSMTEVLSEVSDNIRRWGNLTFAVLREEKDMATLAERVEKEVYTILPEIDRWYENLLVNHLFYEQFPYVDPRLKEEDVSMGFVAVCSFLRLITMCSLYAAIHGAPEGEELPALSSDLKTVFADAAAALFRYVEHSSFYYNAAVLIKRGDMTGSVLLMEV